MAIIKKVDGKEITFANKSVIDHNQLTNRDAYGAHSISSIRKLPEKLTKIKNDINNLDTKIYKVDELEENLSQLNSKLNQDIENAKKINIQENEAEGTFTFTNYENEQKTIQSGYKPDEDTITLDQNKKMTLKKVYTYPQFIGSGTKESPISILTDPQTIVPNNDNVLQTIGIHAGVDGILLTGEYIDNELKELNKGINDLTDQLNKDISNINEKDIIQDNQIYDLQTRTKGMGGYLDTNNFGDLSKKTDEEKQTLLTEYAKQEINVTEKTQIFNGTKVINSFDKHLWILTNTPDSTPAVFEWEDQGVEQKIALATNNLAGLVKGSLEDLQGSIDTLGHITINGLEEELNSKASLIEENNFIGKNNFNAETIFNAESNHNANINITNNVLKILNNIANKNTVTQYNTDKIIIDENNNATYNLKFPKKSGTFALSEDLELINIILNTDTTFNYNDLTPNKLYIYTLDKNLTNSVKITFNNGKYNDNTSILYNVNLYIDINQPIIMSKDINNKIYIHNAYIDIPNIKNSKIEPKIGSGIILTIEDNKVIDLKNITGIDLHHSYIKNNDSTALGQKYSEDVWVTHDPDTSLIIKHEDNTTSSSFSISKGYAKQSTSIIEEESNIKTSSIITNGSDITFNSNGNTITLNQIIKACTIRRHS